MKGELMFTRQEMEKIKGLERYINYALRNESSLDRFVREVRKITDSWCEHDYIITGENFRYPIGDIRQCRKCGHIKISEKE